MEQKEVCKVVGKKRVQVKLPLAKERVMSFAEAEPTFTLAEAVEEAKRCTASNPCVYCEVCQLLCPDLCIIRDGKTGHMLIDLDYCKGCSLCALFCPHGAIEMVVDE
jgi:glutamate synthase (NADPH/NADH) small chain